MKTQAGASLDKGGKIEQKFKASRSENSQKIFCEVLPLGQDAVLLKIAILLERDDIKTIF